jgi:hypothetical protein
VEFVPQYFLHELTPECSLLKLATKYFHFRVFLATPLKLWADSCRLELQISIQGPLYSCPQILSRFWFHEQSQTQHAPLTSFQWLDYFNGSYPRSFCCVFNLLQRFYQHIEYLERLGYWYFQIRSLGWWVTISCKASPPELVMAGFFCPQIIWQSPLQIDFVCLMSPTSETFCLTFRTSYR